MSTSVYTSSDSISVYIIADSISENGDRITTIEATYPYVIHAQVLTHRAFSRNAQSNRAFPTKKLIQRILGNPYNPVFRKNQAGMQAGPKAKQFIPLLIWSLARRTAILAARTMSWIGIHKETTNRLLAPFMHITAVITSTEWENFFQLRIHDDAQPEIQELATKIKTAMVRSAPKRLLPGQWHLPYVPEAPNLETGIMVSVARCARVSYLNHDQSKPEPTKDLALYHSLINSKPIHGSPAEHQATPIKDNDDLGITHWNKEGAAFSNNFKGWVQYRALL